MDTMLFSISNFGLPTTTSLSEARPHFKLRNPILALMLACLALWGYLPVAEVWGITITPFTDKDMLGLHLIVWPMVLLCLFGAKHLVLRLYVAVLWLAVLFDVADSHDLLSMVGNLLNGSGSDSFDARAIAEFLGKFLKIGFVMLITGLIGFLILPFAPFYKSNNNFWSKLFNTESGAYKLTKLQTFVLKIVAKVKLELVHIHKDYQPTVVAIKAKEKAQAIELFKAVPVLTHGKLAVLMAAMIGSCFYLFAPSMPSAGDLEEVLREQYEGKRHELDFDYISVKNCKEIRTDEALCIVKLKADLIDDHGDVVSELSYSDYMEFERIDGDWR